MSYSSFHPAAAVTALIGAASVTLPFTSATPAVAREQTVAGLTPVQRPTAPAQVPTFKCSVVWGTLGFGSGGSVTRLETILSAECSSNIVAFGGQGAWLQRDQPTYNPSVNSVSPASNPPFFRFDATNCGSACPGKYTDFVNVVALTPLGTLAAASPCKNEAPGVVRCETSDSFKVK